MWNFWDPTSSKWAGGATWLRMCYLLRVMGRTAQNPGAAAGQGLWVWAQRQNPRLLGSREWRHLHRAASLAVQEDREDCSQVLKSNGIRPAGFWTFGDPGPLFPACFCLLKWNVSHMPVSHCVSEADNLFSRSHVSTDTEGFYPRMDHIES